MSSWWRAKQQRRDGRKASRNQDTGWDTEFEVVVPQEGAQLRHLVVNKILDEYTRGRSEGRDENYVAPCTEELLMLEAVLLACTEAGFTNLRYDSEGVWGSDWILVNYGPIVCRLDMSRSYEQIHFHAHISHRKNNNYHEVAKFVWRGDSIWCSGFDVASLLIGR